VNRSRNILLWVAIGLLILLFTLQGGAKVMGAEHEVVAFTERWGYPLWFMYAVGVLELAGAAGLLLPSLRAWAALGLVGLMLGAISTHVRVAEWFALPLPLTALAFALWVAWVSRGQAPILKNFRRQKPSS